MYKKSHIAHVVKHHPAPCYIILGRIWICNILWLLRWINGFFWNMLFMWLSYAWACPSLPTERECFALKYICMLFLNNVCNEAIWQKDTKHLSEQSYLITNWVLDEVLCIWNICKSIPHFHIEAAGLKLPTFWLDDLLHLWSHSHPATAALVFVSV